MPHKTTFFIVTAVKTSNVIELTGSALWRIRNVSPVRYEPEFFLSQKTAFFIVTAVRTPNLA
jgi:hypothetical protein